MSGLDALTAAITDPSPENLQEAADEVARAWVRRDRDDFQASREYAAIFDALGRLHPLAAVRLGYELRASHFLHRLGAELFETDVQAAEQLIRRFLRALELRTAGEVGEDSP